MARSDLTEEALEDCFARHDPAAVAALFDDASDRDRARVRDFVERTLGFRFRRATEQQDRDREGAICAAMLGASKAQTISQRQFYWLRGDPPIDSELVVRILAARSERFLASLGKVGLSTSWGFVRPLILAGLIDPETDTGAYIRTMIVGLAVGRNASVRTALLADRQLLDDEVWQIFCTPGVMIQHLGPAWTEALVQLTAEGELERSRILDCCLQALATDFRPGELGWFAGLLRELEPTQEELAERSEAVIGLLGAPEPAVVKLALESVKPLVEQRAVPLGHVVEQLAHPLGGTRKNLAIGALSMLQRIAEEANPGLRDRAMELAATGLAHTRPDVAERSLSVIERCTKSEPSETVRQALLSYVDIATPSLRSRTAELAGVADVVEPVGVDAADGIPAAAQPSRADLLGTERRIEEATELDEIVGLFATALEAEGTADDLERAIAGALASPVNNDRPGTADLISPIRKRARQILERSWPTHQTGLVAGLALAWAERTVVRFPRSRAPGGDERSGVLGWLDKRAEQPQLPPTPSFFIQGRVVELIAALATGQPVRAIAEPTHRGGILDPDELSQRDRSRSLGPYDERLARLRGGHAQGIASQTGWGIGHSGYGPSYHATFEPSGRDLDPLLAAGVQHLGNPRRQTNWWNFGGHLGAEMGLSLVPWSPHVVIGMAVKSLVTRRGHQPPHNDPLPVVRLLAEQCWPLDGPGSPLLALALTENTEYQAAAVDAVIAGVDDGRFDSMDLAKSVATLLDGVVLTRLTGPCVDIAAAGPLHRAHVQQFLLELVALIGLEKPKGLHGPLETLAEVSVGGVRVPDHARAVLETLAESSSKAGKSAKAVLAS